MAPFTRGRGAYRGGGLRGSQRPSRGGSSRGRNGAARGAKKSHTNRDTFYSTRVEETAEDEDDDIEGEIAQQVDVGDTHSIDASENSSDSDDDEEVPAIGGIRSYSSLLESLNANTQQTEPQPKRRKIQKEKILEVVDEDLVEAEEPDLAEDLEADSEVEGDATAESSEDPFVRHFSDRDEASMAQAIKDASLYKASHAKLVKPEGWSTTSEGPLDRANNATTGGRNNVTSINDLHIKQKVKGAALKLVPRLDGVAANVASDIFCYKDVLFPQRTLENAELLRKLSCIHSVNHVLKTRDKVIKNNDRLAKHESSEELELRDQGFTRPKVLILLPTRNSCVRYVDSVVSICEPEQQENKKRFQDSYGNGEDLSPPDKPPDFRDLFAGNNDDMFRLGLKFTRKAMKFFSPFYNSDIIIASPLGLRMAIGGDDPKKKEDHDFLSSIEIVLVDQADAMAMQNWEHVDFIFDHLNLQPKETHGCDFSRVKYWYLNHQAKHLRQTILLSTFNFPGLNKVYTKSLANIAGKVKYNKKVEGAIVNIGTLAKQNFSRFNCTTPSSEPDDRFNYFTTAIVPLLAKSHLESRKGVLVFIPSYADFVRVRNYFASSPDTENISFGSISEYTSVQEVARARSHFQSARHSVLLYTERVHHFRRYKLNGVKSVIMYSLPDNPVFYEEIVGGFLQGSIAAGKLSARDASARVLFSPLDVLKLERVVGSSRFVSMAKDRIGDTFVFE